MKNVLTITGIRPDFIRMSEIFKKLDTEFNHILIHTGQHFDKILSDVFFNELKIRRPNFTLKIGGPNKEHYHQSAELSIQLIDLIRKENLNPDLIIFLGDSNSVTSAMPLKKEGYKIAHIEAGMRSGDKRMLEEINRTVCDHCSDYHFVYHKDYKENLVAENLPEENIFVVGNTIVEVLNKNSDLFVDRPGEDYIVLDIHRPENFKYENRLINILTMSDQLSYIYDIPVKLLNFKRTMENIKKFNIPLYGAQIVELMSYRDYLKFQYNAKFIISDSGTAQEEPALFNKPVIVPRDYTERPQSMKNHCSYMVDVNNLKYSLLHAPKNIAEWLEHKENILSSWLGNGNTSELIINHIKKLC